MTGREYKDYEIAFICKVRDVVRASYGKLEMAKAAVRANPELSTEEIAAQLPPRGNSLITWHYVGERDCSRWQFAEQINGRLAIKFGLPGAELRLGDCGLLLIQTAAGVYGSELSGE